MTAADPTASPPSGATTDELLRRVLERLDQMDARMTAFEGLAQSVPGTLAMGVDTFDELARTLQDRGTSIGQIAGNAALALSRLGTLLESREFVTLMNSGVLDPNAVAVVGRAGSALTHATTEGAERIGVFALLRELNDPGVRNGIAFGLNVLRAFGAGLDAVNRPNPEER
jgi:hypothetical protein